VNKIKKTSTPPLAVNSIPQKCQGTEEKNKEEGEMDPSARGRGISNAITSGRNSLDEKTLRIATKDMSESLSIRQGGEGKFEGRI